MSFFGALAAGAAEGAASGINQEANLSEKLAMLRGTQDIQQQGRLELQANRAADRSDQIAQAASLRAELAAGRAGAGGHSYNLFQQMMAAKTPEDQQAFADQIGMTSGSDDAKNAVLDRYHMLPNTTTQFPTADDDGNAMPGPTSVTQKAAYNRQLGAQAIQRVMAIAMDPAKLKDYEQGATQGLRNDVVTSKTLPPVIADPNATPDDYNDALTPLDPKAGAMADKNTVYGDRTDAQRQIDKGKSERAAAADASRNSRGSVESARKTYQADLVAAAGAFYKDRPAAQARADASRARLDALLNTATAAPAAGPAGGAARNPKAAAAAYKAAQGY
jgi:hypothetical protein